jgi:integrase
VSSGLDRSAHARHNPPPSRGLIRGSTMPRQLGRLNALAVSRASRPGLYPDGGGLYLQVTKAGVRSWTFRFMRDGRERYMGLGPLHTVSLAEARAKAVECRKLRLAGLDPIEARNTARNQAKLDAAKAMTFRACAEAYIEAHKAGWKSAKHAAQWPSTLKTYAYPVFGELPVQAADVALVMKAVEPIWRTKTETASRLRGRIEAVLDWAAVRGYRAGDNPARWRGHLDHLLPGRAKVQRVAHHAALPYAEIGGFMAALRQQAGVSALALELTILTAARSGEVLEARWAEIDLEAKVWTIPPERMKAGKAHRVSLSEAAVTVVRKLAAARVGEFVCPGGRKGKSLSNMAMLKLLERMDRADLTVHGFRSTFRDWAAERTNVPRDVAEMALAHTIGDKVEAAYRRGDLFAKRRRLMEAWARYCANATPDGTIGSIAQRARSRRGRGR